MPGLPKASWRRPRGGWRKAQDEDERRRRFDAGCVFGDWSEVAPQRKELAWLL